MMRLLRFLKRIWILNFFRRIWKASKHFNKKYLQILKWGIKSKEDTNYTYNLTPDNLSYLAHTIAVITNKDHAEIKKYLDEAQSDADLVASIQNSIKGSDERWFADTEVHFGRRLGWYAFVRAIKPKTVIETGVDKGLGSILLCSALLKNKKEGYDGNFYGTDINPAAGYLLRGKYKEVGKILYGDSIDSLSKFEGNIDLFINDSDHSAEYEYREYETIKPLINENSIILGDNSHCTNKLSQFSLEHNRSFLFFKEVPLNHWYPGGGIGISYVKE